MSEYQIVVNNTKIKMLITNVLNKMLVSNSRYSNMMKYLFAFFCFLLLAVTGCNSSRNTIAEKESPFHIAASPDLQVTWKGEKLIMGDSLSWIVGKGVGKHAETYQMEEKGGWEITNVWHEHFVLPYRREVGLSPNGKKVELTIQAHQDALMDSFPTPLVTYKLLLPALLFTGATWDAFVGRSQDGSWRSGKLVADTRDGLIVNGARWITFNTTKGSVTFDFNPHGVPTYYVGGMNTMAVQWTLTRQGDQLELSISTPATNYGGDLTSKVTIFEGGKEDYLKHHAVTRYHYFSEIPPERLYCFNETAGEQFTTALVEAPTPEKGYGWADPDRVQLSGNRLPGALYASCHSTGPNSFTTYGLRPGLYLVTLRASALEGDKGPFDVSLNGEVVYEKVKVDKGTVANMTFVRWIEGGKADIQFSGDWAVSVIGFQLFMHSEEDFQFRRGNWIKEDGYCPGVLFANYYDTPPRYGKSITYSPLAGEIDEISDIPELPELEEALPDQQADGLAWRFKSPLGTMGSDNWGTFNDFNTPEKIEKRLKQVKEGGISAIILNGFLSRHTYATHLDRVEKNIREIVKKAHQLDMKIIDHQDLTILWNADMGFRFLAANPGYLQHGQNNGLPTWGLCPVNPDFKYGYFFPYISGHLKNTRVDGFMLDETCFHFENFCNCSHCREAYHQATGLTLPDNEGSPLLKNRRSKLWKSWIEWRKHAVAQWRIDLSRLTHQINPSFSNVEYYSEGGFLTNYASYGQGGDLPLSAKSKDFLGTEIMSRDVWDDYRYNFTSRNMYNSLRETYGSPIFGLVYPDGVLNYAIFGWACNNMFGQVTWSFSSFIDDEMMNRYTSWPENMNNRTSVPFTDVAIIFSRSTRDWSVKNMADYPKEIMGTGQFLSERNMQHTFILDDALTAGFDLSRYRVLLAPGMDCLSTEQEELLTRFVFNGGTLFLSGEAGTLDPYGDPRATRAFHQILTDDKLLEAAQTYFVTTPHGKGRIVYASKKHAINEYATSIRDSRMVYTFSPDPAITLINEKILSDVIGESQFKSISIPAKVFVTVYQDVETGATMVHLLNATGITAKHGDALPTPNPTWTPVEEEITFEIALPSLSKAYYTSPDSEGHKAVNWGKTGENSFTITVPRGTLEKYGIVYLQL